MNVEVLPHDFCKLQPPKLTKNVQEPVCQTRVVCSKNFSRFTFFVFWVTYWWIAIWVICPWNKFEEKTQCDSVVCHTATSQNSSAYKASYKYAGWCCYWSHSLGKQQTINNNAHCWDSQYCGSLHNSLPDWSVSFYEIYESIVWEIPTLTAYLINWSGRGGGRQMASIVWNKVRLEFP